MTWYTGGIMNQPKGFEKLGNLFNQKPSKKPPAHPWQETALEVIDRLHVPAHKRNSVFLVAKKYSRDFILKCLNDTKELSTGEEQWRYFFKLVNKPTSAPGLTALGDEINRKYKKNVSQ